MIKITVTIEETQDKDIRDIRLECAKKGDIKNYSKVMREVLDKGLKHF